MQTIEYQQFKGGVKVTSVTLIGRNLYLVRSLIYPLREAA